MPQRRHSGRLLDDQQVLIDINQPDVARGDWLRQRRFQYFDHIAGRDFSLGIQAQVAIYLNSPRSDQPSHLGPGLIQEARSKAAATVRPPYSSVK